MTLEQLGSLGEFVSAIAVVLSLLYVAHEIRQNSRSTRLAALQSHLEAAQRVLELPARDRDLARVLRIGLDSPESLSEDEMEQFRAWLRLAARIAENLFVQHRAGNIEEVSWQARARAFLAVLGTPGGSAAWQSIAGMHREDFQAWVSDAMDVRTSDAV